MSIKDIKEMKIEELIHYLCILWNKETKKARDTEIKIIKELANRNVVNENYMMKLFEN